MLANKAGATDPVFVQKLEAETPVAEANYGESVSISDGKIAIGAPNDASVSCSSDIMTYQVDLALLNYIIFPSIAAGQSLWKCVLLLSG